MYFDIFLKVSYKTQTMEFLSLNGWLCMNGCLPSVREYPYWKIFLKTQVQPPVFSLAMNFLVPTTCKIDRSAFIWLHIYLEKTLESSIASESEFISNIWHRFKKSSSNEILNIVQPLLLQLCLTFQGLFYFK